MNPKKKHDCLDYLMWDKAKINEGDDYHNEKYPCSKCGKTLVYKYRFEGVYDESDSLLLQA